jgi:peptidyl-prolyl cis-trans isomerase B (cyclophilin B)
LEDILASKKKQQNLFSSTSNKLAEYEAKQQVHAKLTTRRKNDNKIALIAAGAALVVALGSQFAYSAIHPEPIASASATPTATTPVAQESNGPLVPNVSIAENRVWNGTMAVNGSALGIKLFGDKAPQALSLIHI